MRKLLTGRRLALLGVVIATQLLTACCLPPRWYGSRGGHYADGPGGRDHQQPSPPSHDRRPR